MTSTETSAGSPTPDGSPAPAGQPWWRHRLGIGLGAVVALLALALVVLWVMQRGQALPNTEVAGVAVGGMTAPQIADAIGPVARDRETDEVVFTFEDERFEIVPEDVGYRIDDDATVERALRRGRTNPLTDPFARISSLWRTRDVGLVERVDDGAIAGRIDAIADEVDRETDLGSVTVSGEDLQISIAAPVGAAEVRREEAAEALTDALRRPGSEELALPVDADDPPFDPARAEEAAEQLERAVAEPVTLTAEGDELTIDRPQLAQLVETRLTADEDGFELLVTEESVEEVLGEAARDRFDVSPVDVRYGVPRTPPTTFSDAGSTTWSPVAASASITEGRDGREFDPAAAAESLTTAVRNAERTADAELIITEPDVPNARAEDLRPTHLLGTFTTSYTAGQTRVANIQRLADVIDNTQVAPGEQFSINDISGERSCDKGYQPAGTIVRGELVDTCGGGVSQFGTTTFNAAFFAGVQLDQWQAHSFYISRYPEGREATLSFPQLDVRFTNDTDGVVVVRASYTSTTVTVSVYGRPVAQSVRASHGSRSSVRQPTVEERTTSSLPQGQTRTIQSTGAPGFNVEVVRTITRMDGSTDSRTIRTTYRPQNGIVERGTGPPAPAPPPPEDEDDEGDEDADDDGDDAGDGD